MVYLHMTKELPKKTRGRHGMTGSREHITWSRMMARCFNPNHPAFKHYGGRGIEVCERWWKFQNFYDDMGKRTGGGTIDRIDNNGDYTPENCKWSTQKEQCRNRRSSRYLQVFGETKTVAEWAEDRRCKCGYYTLLGRLKIGWSAEDALTKETRKIKAWRGIAAASS